MSSSGDSDRDLSQTRDAMDTRVTRATVTQHDGDMLLRPTTAWGVTVVYSSDPESQSTSHPIRGKLTIGRLPSSRVQLVIGDPSLSRVHATLAPAATPGIARIDDHGSKNGTFVNGVVAQSQYVAAGSIIRVGSTLLLFHALDLVPSDFTPDWNFYGRSSALRTSLFEIDRVAPTDLAVLILGESGTGKELAASRLHSKSGRRGDFIALNCAAIPPNLVESTLFGHVRGAFTGATTDSPGMFESAKDGTLFLDEIGELPLDLQPKLLRVLENRQYHRVGSVRSMKTNARIVAATNRDLRELVDANTFRLDLLARLQGFNIKLAPIRDRKDDILLLADRFLREFAPKKTFDWNADFAEALLLYDWPMNVRELRSTIERIALLDPGDQRLRVQDLPSEIRDSVNRTPPPADDEPRSAAPGGRAAPSKETLIALLRQSGGNVARLATHFGKDRKQVYRWLERHDLRPEDFRPA